MAACSVLFLATGWIGLAVQPSETAPEEPDYPHGDFSGECSMCHSPDGWTPAVISSDFDHTEVSDFALLHSHTQTKCSACHATLDFSATDPACSSCHVDIHRAELGMDCERCHTSRSFIDPSTMARAHLATRFPLRGTHRTADCEDCHRPGGAGASQWVNTSADCLSCHRDAYLATTNPDHVAGSFPETCEQCHSANGWRPAGFNHNTIPAGAVCVDCHQANYQATIDPDHSSAGYPTTCELCHSTNGWRPVVSDGGNHDALFFPIYSGKHRGKWAICSTCHTTPNNFSQFSCFGCHPHSDQAKTDADHQGETGYVYDSQACLSCHPQGNS